MVKKCLLMLVCAFLVFQTEGLVSAGEKAENKNIEENAVAIVNGEIIQRENLDKRLQVYKNLNQEITDSMKRVVLDQLIDKVLLQQFVKEQKIVVSVDEIQAELEKVKFFIESSQKDSGVTLEKVLESRGSSIVKLREEIRNTVALSKYLSKVINDGEMKAFFDSNLDLFNGEEIRASHLLIDTRNLTSNEEIEKAREKIEKLKKEIDDGADFAGLATKHSDCPSAENGGDLGYFEKKGTMVEPFSNAAFLLQVGEVSDPVKTQYGYHLIKVTDRREGKEVSYDEVKDTVDQIYRDRKTENLLKSLREKANIEIFI